MQREGHVGGGGDGHAAVDYEAVGALEGFEGSGSSGDDRVAAVAVVFKHPQVDLNGIEEQQHEA